MTNVVRFPAARLCLLRATGELVDAVGDEADPAGLRYLTVSRALCRHTIFRAPAGTARRFAGNAARLHAEMHCPFAGGDWLLTPVSDGVAIWWWDAQTVRALIGDRWCYDAAAIVPETLLEPRGDGWRQMVTADGHDLQLWSGGALQLSYWRRQAFDPAAWATLAMGMPPGVTLPDAIPSPVGLKLNEPVRRPRELPRAPGWPDLTRIAAGVAVAALIATGWFSGRAIAHNRAAAATIAQSAQWRETGEPHNRAVASRIVALRRIATLAAQPDPVPAAAAAFAILGRAGATPSAWRVDRESISLTLGEKPTGATPRDIAVALERDPLFAGVRASRQDEKDMRFEAALASAATLQTACATC